MTVLTRNNFKKRYMLTGKMKERITQKSKDDITFHDLVLTPQRKLLAFERFERKLQRILSLKNIPLRA